MDQCFVILRGEEKSAVGGILELFQQHCRQFLRELKIAAAPSGLQQLQQRIDKKRVVVEIGGQVGTPVLVCCEQTAVAPKVMPDEIHRGGCGQIQIRSLEHP